MIDHRHPLIIITGASSSIGAEIAKQFSQAGFSLGLLARNLKALEDLNLPNALCRLRVAQYKLKDEARHDVEAAIIAQ